MSISLNNINSEVVRAHRRIDDISNSMTGGCYIVCGAYKDYDNSSKLIKLYRNKKTIVLTNQAWGYAPDLTMYNTLPNSDIYAKEGTLKYNKHDSTYVYYYFYDYSIDNYFAIIQSV